MLSGIQRLLANGTSPLEFRSTLRRKTKAIRQFGQPIERIKTLQARIPLTVSGGEIVELMSLRLRQLLQHAETPEKILSLRKDRSGAAFGRIGNGNSKGNDFPDQPASVMEAAGPFFSSGPKSGNRADKPWITDSKDASTRAGAWPSLSEESSTEILTKTVTSEILPERFALEKRDPLPTRGRSGPLESSAFLRTLQQYGQFAHLEDAGEPDSENRPVPGLTGKKPPVFPASSREGRSAGSWSEMPGQEVAERLRALTQGNGNLPSSSIREFASSSSGPVRVQNVFHIEVQGQGTGDASFGDLSTRLADILREQAVQHGIDLT
jgi:hypothetical protein